MKIIYIDRDVAVCIKPPRVLSTDEPGGLPELLRMELGDSTAEIRTVHRLDRVVSGLMVVARNRKAASELSRQVRQDEFEKEYYAVLHGVPDMDRGLLRDFLHRDKKERKSYLVPEGSPEAQEAILEYTVLDKKEGMSLVRVLLHTGRTHQIRAQFSGRGLPIFGDRKYSLYGDPCEIALWSHKIGFTHPATGERMVFAEEPEQSYPWDCFSS